MTTDPGSRNTCLRLNVLTALGRGGAEREAEGDCRYGGPKRMHMRTVAVKLRRETVSYEHPRLSIAITSPRREFADEAVHRRRPGAMHHLAFKVESRAELDRLHVELLKIGAAIVIPPREFPEYTPPGYYALFFKDPDGIRYEIVTH